MIRTSPDAAPPKARREGPHPLARAFKRGLDIVVSATSVFLLLPLMLMVAGTIWALDRGSPVVREPSLGCGGRTFGRLRFRTTRPRTAAPSTLGTAGGLTPIGRLLRETFLDELPTLLNVLQGEMSLVGSRPIPVGTARPGPDVDAHPTMPPGLTGPWQFGEPRDATEPDKVALDQDYARHWSLRRDFAIMLRGVADTVERRDRR